MTLNSETKNQKKHGDNDAQKKRIKTNARGQSPSTPKKNQTKRSGTKLNHHEKESDEMGGDKGPTRGQIFRARQKNKTNKPGKQRHISAKYLRQVKHPSFFLTHAHISCRAFPFRVWLAHSPPKLQSWGCKGPREAPEKPHSLLRAHKRPKKHTPHRGPQEETQR